MGILSILVAAAAAWLFGALWYMTLSKPWLEAVSRDWGPDRRLDNRNPVPFILSAVAMIVVAGMMRHVFAMAGIASWDAGLIAGLGVGAFFITPWIVINNAYPGRPFLLSVIDGGYAIIGCGLIGLVLSLFHGS
ncbi:DUF1761 family protein [Aquicoccus sp. SCR17]|nr:DUF1761 family protein [Carideicomes alvinocaridis]